MPRRWTSNGMLIQSPRRGLEDVSRQITMSELQKLKRRKTKTVTINHEGETFTFRLRSLTAREWTTCTLASTPGGEVQDDLFARFVAWSLCDENGEPTHASEEGKEEVGSWPWHVVNALYAEVTELNNANVDPSKNSMSRAG
jgi:hypothetical protein